MSVDDLLKSRGEPISRPLRNSTKQFLPNIWPFIGLAYITRKIYENNNLELELQDLKQRLKANYQDADALMDAAFILMANGQVEQAIPLQKLAICIRKNYKLRFGDGSDLQVLALVTPGDLMANMPIEFLLEQTNVELTYHFVDSNTPDLNDVPFHDVAFLAIGQSSENEPVLKNVQKLLDDWQRPVINGRPDKINELSRVGVVRLLASEKSIIAVPWVECSRLQLLELKFVDNPYENESCKIAFPFIVRPPGTHAGQGMQKIDNRSQLETYLANYYHASFLVCPFIDYRSTDGFFRKQRVVFIDGCPFPSHQATSKNWMVHYLNADMELFEERRRDEANWFANFKSFVARHQNAMNALPHLIGLDYFAIDCAETKDGKLLVFEVDVAMIVHALDSEVLFPYKKPAMAELSEGFLEFLKAREKPQIPAIKNAAL